MESHTHTDVLHGVDPAPAARSPFEHAENGRRSPRVFGFERWMIRRLLQRLHDPRFAVVLWNGELIAPAQGANAGRSPVARLVFHDRGALYRLIRDPEFQFGELYSEGRIGVEGDLYEFMREVCLGQLDAGSVPQSRRAWFRLPRRNSLSRAKQNIHHHYDIGNEFYKLWLDERMVYTCAYFPNADASLEAAQFAKLEHVCRKLRLRPGQTVIEAGCGWGALALHMAKHHGVTVRAFNISHEQVALARERARAEGLVSQVEFIEDDYRNITGRCDAFASVGMLEHVGTANYRTLGAVVDRCLSDSGLALIHTIGRNRAAPPDRWTETRIFPGGYTPSLREMADIFEPFSFSILDVENLRLHYALTLRHWLARFDAHRTQVARMFDDRFIRMWRLYLAGARAAFDTGWTQLFQVVFTRANNNSIPLTREDLYATPNPPLPA